MSRHVDDALARVAWDQITFAAPDLRIVGYELLVADVRWAAHAGGGRGLGRRTARLHLTRRPGAWRVMVVDTSAAVQPVLSPAARSPR